MAEKQYELVPEIVNLRFGKAHSREVKWFRI
jgi:hypothetical protein